MKIIAIANGKGGSAKTTTAVNLAGILSTDRTVLLVDTDPQGSAAWWGERAGLDIAQEQDPSTLGKLRQVSGYDVVVVDTAPRWTQDPSKQSVIWAAASFKSCLRCSEVAI